MNHSNSHLQPGQSAIDIEQVDQFQPEIAPRSTTVASTDVYASAQIESHRRSEHEQGDPDNYRPRFEGQ